MKGNGRAEISAQYVPQPDEKLRGQASIESVMSP